MSLCSVACQWKCPVFSEAGETGVLGLVGPRQITSTLRVTLLTHLSLCGNHQHQHSSGSNVHLVVCLRRASSQRFVQHLRDCWNTANILRARWHRTCGAALNKPISPRERRATTRSGLWPLLPSRGKHSEQVAIPVVRWEGLRLLKT